MEHIFSWSPEVVVAWKGAVYTTPVVRCCARLVQHCVSEAEWSAWDTLSLHTCLLSDRCGNLG